MQLDRESRYAVLCTERKSRSRHLGRSRSSSRTMKVAVFGSGISTKQQSACRWSTGIAQPNQKHEIMGLVSNRKKGAEERRRDSPASNVDEGLLSRIRILPRYCTRGGKGGDQRSRKDEQRTVDLGWWWRFVTGRSRSSRNNWREAAAQKYK